MIITTMALNPNTERDFQIMLTPFVSRILADYLKKDFILPINFLGAKHAKKTSQERSEEFERYSSLLNILNIKPQSFLLDTDTEFLSFVQDCVLKLEKLGLLSIRYKNVLKCFCGSLEGISSHLSKMAGRSGKIVLSKSNKFVCKLCNTEAIYRHSECLFFSRNCSDFYSLPSFYQGWVKSEFESLSSNLDGDLYISRNRACNPVVSVGGKSFFVDVDFVCSFMALWTSKIYNEKEIVIVATPKTIINAFSTAFITSTLLDNTKIHIVVPPMINWLDGNLIGHITADDFIENMGELRYRWALALGLCWNRKEIVVDSSFLKHVKSPKITDVRYIETPSIEDFFVSFNHGNIRKILTTKSDCDVVNILSSIT